MPPFPPFKTHCLALVTIGQSPRHDYTEDVPSLLPPNTTLIQHGALDSLGLPDVHDRLWPSPDTKQVLVSRMRDGTEVKMDAEKLEPLIKECVQRVASQEHPDTILLLCTGNLPSYDVLVPVVGPQDALRRYFEEKEKGMKSLVIISPEERQLAPAKARWDGVGGCVVLGGTVATPYGEGSRVELKAAAEWVASLTDKYKAGNMHGLGNITVYMDCMGYTLEHKRLVENITKGMGYDVVVPREVVFRAVARLYD